jgi:hypothetical protein
MPVGNVMRRAERDIDERLKHRNPKKYVWRASDLEILEKIKRAREALANEVIIST